MAPAMKISCKIKICLNYCKTTEIYVAKKSNNKKTHGTKWLKLLQVLLLDKNDTHFNIFSNFLMNNYIFQNLHRFSEFVCISPWRKQRIKSVQVDLNIAFVMVLACIAACVSACIRHWCSNVMSPSVQTMHVCLIIIYKRRAPTNIGLRAMTTTCGKTPSSEGFQFNI
jgi:hypothetical protein